MTPSIRLLPDHVVNLVAAGEVVERPSNVVKELVENSLDANSQYIQIRIGQAGQDYIEVSDDGKGIAPEELTLAVTNHATSKISQLEDLTLNQTLGFRGEALASIQSIARVSISSRTADQASGTELLAHAGTHEVNHEIAMAQGTRVKVEKLFANVPAREKYLRAVNTEWRYMRKQCEALALAHPTVGFELSHNEKTVFRFDRPAALDQDTIQESTLQRVTKLFGAEPGAWCYLADHRMDMKLQGYLATPDVQALKRKELLVVINERAVQAPEVIAAVRDAYRGLTHGHGEPAGVLWLTIDLDNIDANVHPAKTKVRLRFANSVYRFVQQAVHANLGNYQPNRKVSLAQETSNTQQQQPVKPGYTSANTSQTTSEYSSSAAEPRPSNNFAQPSHSQVKLGESFGSYSSDQASKQRALPKTGSNANSIPASISLQQTQIADQPRIGRVIGQIKGTFILVENADGLMVIDMHAAHERIVYEELAAQWKKQGSLTSQPLLVPIEVKLSQAQRELLDTQIQTLVSVGIHLEIPENGSASITSAPAGFSPAQLRELLDGLIASLETLEQTELPAQASQMLTQTVEAILGDMACKMALKANTILDQRQIAAFLDSFADTQRISWCNHGRPSWNVIEFDQLDRICRRGE